MIAIIDYGAGNLQSVRKALDFIGCETRVTDRPEDLETAEAAVLPGVGAFGDAMASLESRGLVEPVRAFIRQGKPFLGICLGLQLLFDSSEESPGVKGLGVLPGKILRIPDGEGLKVPHIGWNSLSFPNGRGRLFAGLSQEPYVLLFESGGPPDCGCHYGVRGKHPRRSGKGESVRLPVPPGEKRRRGAANFAEFRGAGRWGKGGVRKCTQRELFPAWI